METGTFYPDRYHFPACLLLVFCKLHNYQPGRFFIWQIPRLATPMQKSLTLNDLKRSKWYAVTGNQKVICYGRNVRLMLVLLTYLFVVTLFDALVNTCSNSIALLSNSWCNYFVWSFFGAKSHLICTRNYVVSSNCTGCRLGWVGLDQIRCMVGRPRSVWTRHSGRQGTGFLPERTNCHTNKSDGNCSVDGNIVQFESTNC